MRTRIVIAAAASLVVSLSMALAVYSPASAASLASSAWTATYWNNTGLGGKVVATRTEKRIAYNWRNASPIPGTVNRDRFSVRWTRVVNFKAGTVIFRAVSDDGMRAWIDNKRLINDWGDHPYQTAIIPYNVTAGNHTLKVEYYDAFGPALANFSWAPLSANPWDVQYFRGISLGGNVVVEQQENNIRNDWGNTSPAPGVTHNDFSVRYARDIDFPGGPVTFKVTVAGGFRLYVGGDLIMDRWFDHGVETNSVKRTIAAGTRHVRLEYYSRHNPAVLRLKIKKP